MSRNGSKNIPVEVSLLNTAKTCFSYGGEIVDDGLNSNITDSY